jgi:hypothetical protein
MASHGSARDLSPKCVSEGKYIASHNDAKGGTKGFNRDVGYLMGSLSYVIVYKGECAFSRYVRVHGHGVGCEEVGVCRDDKIVKL